MGFRGGTLRGDFFCQILAFAFLSPLSLASDTSKSTDNSFAIESVNEVKTLKVLIENITDKKSNTFKFKGQALMSSDGSVRGAKDFNCHRETLLATSLLSLTPKVGAAKTLRWICRTQRASLQVLGSLSFTDRSGFFQIEDRWYRGSLELRDTGNSLLVINHVPLDDYISSLLHGEMPHYFESEALKAQAIAARSYAVATALDRRRAGTPFDLLDNPKDQVYPGAHRESSKGNLANEETKGQFLLFDGKVLKSFYHAASGGFSELPAAVWQDRIEKSYSAYQARPNIYDKGKYEWQLSLSSYMFESAFSIGKLIDLRVHTRTIGNRVQALELVGSERSSIIQLRSLRKLLSSISLKSLKFDVIKEASAWKLKGEGWGHGVGLSQIAAQNMAKLGQNYKDILRFHYPLSQLAEIKKGKLKTIDLEKENSQQFVVQAR